MFFKFVFCLLFLWSSWIASTLGVAECNKCQSNKAWCINENQFKLCPNGQTAIGTVMTCEEGLVCTSSDDDICQPREEAMEKNELSCPGTGSSTGEDDCNICRKNGAISVACTTATDFALCKDNKPNEKAKGSCEPEEFCSTELFVKFGQWCANEETFKTTNYNITCAPSGTIPPIPTPEPGKMRIWCDKYKNKENKRYYYVANEDDLSYRTYIYCEKNYELMLNCKSGLYFHEDKQKCLNTKPTN